MKPHDREALSRKVSYLLRHAGDRYGLLRDDQGWVDVDSLLGVLRREVPWQYVEAINLEQMIEASGKKRHEIRDGRIRALYGHSVGPTIMMERTVPPETLYHGTVRGFLSSIQSKGLLPMKRQYVHLSIDEDMAFEIGSRRGQEVVVLRIRAAEAARHGVCFFTPSQRVWLAKKVDPIWIDFPEPD